MNEKRNQKGRYILYLLTIAIGWVGGVTLITIGGTDTLLHLRGALKVGVILLGVILLLITFTLGYLLLSSYVKNNRELRIEEEDERNQMIRGLAAQTSNMILIFLLVTAMLVFSALNYTLPAIILIAITLINNFINFLLIGYYNTKL